MYKPKTIEKIYWTIGEVSESIGFPLSKVRFWVNEFGINPRRGRGNRRKFTRPDIETLERIKFLKGEGFTLAGIKKNLANMEKLKSILLIKNQ